MQTLHTKSYQAFITVLIEARKEAAITQQELAQRIRKPQSFVSKYERRERRVDVVEFIKIIRALKFEPAKILQRVEKAMKG